MPAEAVYVFDACAVVALLKAEPGASVVADLLQDESHRLEQAKICPIRFIR